MNRTVLIPFLALMLCLCSTIACAKTSKGSARKQSKSEYISQTRPGKEVVNLLGSSLAEILLNPSKVVCYALEAKDSVGPDDDVVQNYYVRGEQLVKLSKEDVALIQFALLSNPDCYHDDSPAALMPYEPRIEFLFQRKGRKAHVLISPSDRTWTVIYDDKVQFNHNYSTDSLVARLLKSYLALVPKP